MKNYLDACRRRKEETGESGFSLIELIVVVVILGILAAIAVPVFLGLQDQAKQSSADTIAANAASQVAAAYAKGDTPTKASLANLSDNGEADFTLSGSSIDNFCVTVEKDGKTGKGGPCPAAATP